MMHDFQISNCDTDSISFTAYKPFTKDELKFLINEINDLSPEFMDWADDGYYKKVIILKAKNYILQDFNNKITYKGSALKSSKTEPALKEFLHKIIDTILNEEFKYQEVYNEFVREILAVKDIKRWVSKKSLTSTTYESTRANETKIIDAIKDTEYKEGDKVFLYFTKDGSLKLAEKYENDHDIETLLEKLYKISRVFTHIDNKPVGLLPKDTFINYSLKKNLKLLQIM